jgi:FkbM family methyltransferase
MGIKLKLRSLFLKRKSVQDYSIINAIRHSLVSESSMVLHLGAHQGQEASFYSHLKKKVVWIEANPIVFNSLQQKVSLHAGQSAMCALLGDVNQNKVEFHISNNNAQSSSIFKFGADMNHQKLTMISSITLPMHRLDSIIKPHEIIKNSHWVVDVQGAELLALRGAGSLIEKAFSLEVEVSTKEEYSGGAKFRELKQFLNSKGFFALWEPFEFSHEDIIFIRQS